MTHYIYILHFNEPFSHARHYVGVAAAANLKQRLQAHARGKGSVLTRAIRKAKIGFTLGGLIGVDGHPRIDEQRIKNRKETKQFCEICSKTPYRLKGTQPISVTLLHFKTDSDSLTRDE